jgi:hypothetical protein
VKIKSAAEKGEQKEEEKGVCRKSEWIRELSLNASIVFSQRESFVLIIRVWARGKLEARRGTDFTHLFEANAAAAAGTRVHAFMHHAT